MYQEIKIMLIKIWQADIMEILLTNIQSTMAKVSRKQNF